MARWAIGDIQGCLDPFERLLERIAFDPARDRLWLVGDLVNRGPDSLGVLRRVIALGDAAITVLGNHELHLLARDRGLRPRGRHDTLDDVLAAPDRADLVAWLRSRPLLHHDDGHVLVHAGLAPAWTVAKAAAIAAEVGEALRGERGDDLLQRFARGLTPRFSPGLRGLNRLAAALVPFTLYRMLRPNGEAVSGYTGPPDQASGDLVPWFDHPQRRSRTHTIVFGHWAALGLMIRPGLIGLDSGCVWGKRLSAVRLDDLRVEQVEA